MDLEGTQRLGIRAFLLFLSSRLQFPIIMGLILGLLWTQRQRVPAAYEIWTEFGLQVLFFIWAGILGFVIARSFFEYRGYSFQFDEEFFRVTRGYFSKQELGIVYHQIQYVTIRRQVLDRMMGVGHLVIVTNVGGGGGANDLSAVTLPALDKTKAAHVQRELLRRANQSGAPASVPAKAKTKKAAESDEEEEGSDGGL